MARGFLVFVAPSVLLTLGVVGFPTFLVIRWVKREVGKSDATMRKWI
jgi:hypothetical protein